MRSASFILALSLLFYGVRSQSKLGLEQYSFMHAGENNGWSPVAHYQTSKKWYAEARYNYEDFQTFSLYAGKTFSAENDVSYSLTPMIGGMLGRLNGGSLGLNTELSFRKFSFSSQSQYSLSTDNQRSNFFYSWSELSYQPLNWVYTGVAIQHTRFYQANTLMEPGVLLGFSFQHWLFPLYTFNPFSNSPYFVVGMSWEWKHGKGTPKKITPQLITRTDDLMQ
jgi:hypothetical protein